MILFGSREACIATHHDYSQQCPNCKSFAIEYKVYRPYVHIFWIPFFAHGSKRCVMSCTSCKFTNEYSDKSSYYIENTKTPIYLYSLWLVIVGLIISLYFLNVDKQKEKKIFIDSPKVNDVYLVRKDIHDSTFYSFLKVYEINGDTIVAYPNMYVYYQFVSNLDKSDSFVQHEVFLSKDDLKKMLEEGEIVSVERDYDKASNFNGPILVPADSLY